MARTAAQQEFDVLLAQLAINDVNHVLADGLERNFGDKQGLLGYYPTLSYNDPTNLALPAAPPLVMSRDEWKILLRWCFSEIRREAREEARRCVII